MSGGTHAVDVVLVVVAVTAVVVAVSAAAGRLGLLAPIALTVVGTGVSFLPHMPKVRVDPELMLAAVIPPLLHVAALEMSVPAFRRNLRPIALLAVGHVLFIAALVGVVLHLLVPAVPLAAGVALGAVVGPPDPVAIAALGERAHLPRRVRTILEGEGLANDATALTLLRVAVAVGIGQTVSAAGALSQFAVAAVGGLVVGAAVARVVAWLHRRTEDSLLDNAISVLTPFAAWFAAEELHVPGTAGVLHPSGVVSVVVCGLYVGHRTPVLMNARSRLQTSAFWALARFLLEGTVFFLVGLQLRGIVDDLRVPGRTVAVATVAVLVAVVGGRFLWVFPQTYLPRLLIPRVRRRDPYPHWSVPAVVSWAGIRGVVSLAAVGTLPLTRLDGSAFPARDLLVFLTFAVIVVTLVGQGMTLTGFARLVHLATDDPTEAMLEEAQVRRVVSQAGVDRLEALAEAGELPEVAVERLRASSATRTDSAWERLGEAGNETPGVAARRGRREMIQAEREELIRARDDERASEEVLRSVQLDLDLEEALLSQGADEDLEGGPTHARDACAHLAAAGSAPDEGPADGPFDVCEDCVREGRRDWVHLRQCLTDGGVRCCDSSPAQHSTAHFHASRHPVMRSVEAGETWRWCFVDEVVG